MPAKRSNSSEYLSFAKQLAKESATILQRAQKRPKIVKHKGKQGDYALEADYQSEQHILGRIKKTYPDHGILTEETGKHDADKDYLWIIDPLEGTLNYAHHLPYWAVNIALWHKKTPLVSVVHAPAINELFHAENGKGAHLNGKTITVTKNSKIMDGFYTGNVDHFCEMELSRKLLRYLGCAGLELAYVACGRFDARIKRRGNDPFGYGAGALLVTEAGGKITDMNGKPWKLNSDGALASNGAIHHKLLKLIP